MLADFGHWALDVGHKYAKLREHFLGQQAQDLSRSI